MPNSLQQRNNITGVILAGGTSSRMGRDKATLPVGNRPLVAPVIELFTDAFPQVLVVGDRPERFDTFAVTTVPDLRAGKALGGILTGLTVSETPYIFVAPCDLPTPDRNLLSLMCSLTNEHDVIVPHVNGLYEPLFAIYGKGCIPFITRLLDAGNFCVFDFYDAVRLRRVTLDEFPPASDPARAFLNINTPEQYGALLNCAEVPR